MGYKIYLFLRLNYLSHYHNKYIIILNNIDFYRLMKIKFLLSRMKLSNINYKAKSKFNKNRKKIMAPP